MPRLRLPLLVVRFVAAAMSTLTLALPAAEPANSATAGTILERDREFEASSRITLSANLTPLQVTNLATLGKVWGFLKYHHPAVTAGQKQWDFELFRVMPALLASPDRAEANATVLRWIESLGEVAPRSASRAATGDVHFPADLAWLDDVSSLGPDLSARLRAIHNARPAEQFYVARGAGVGNPLFTRELNYPLIDTPDAGYRLLALFRFWNIIQYWFPYRDLIDDNWHDVLREFIPRMAHAVTADEFQLQLLALIARVHDTHANLRTPASVRPPVGSASLPVVIRFVGQQPVVAHLAPNATEPPCPLQRGDVIVAIDGNPVAKLIAAWSPYYPASNEPTRLRDIARSMTRGPAGSVKLALERAGQIIEVEGTRLADGPWMRSLRFTRSLPGPAFRRLSNHVAYLSLLSAKAADVAQYVEQAAGTQGWILDLRNYPGDFPLLFALSARLIEQPTEFVRFTFCDLANPGVFSFGPGKPTLRPAAPGYSGKIAILVDEVTVSRAEYFAMAFRSVPRATVIGSTTAGADGNYSDIPLPGCSGKLRTGISGIGVFYPDKRPTQRIGIVPDIEAKPTIAGLRDGRDEVLEAAVRHILGPNATAEEIRKLTTIGQ